MQASAADKLFESGDMASCMFFLVDGSVELLGDRGRASITVESGSYFGELSMLVPAVRACTARCESFCDFYVLSTIDFVEAIKQFPYELERFIQISKSITDQPRYVHCPEFTREMVESDTTFVERLHEDLWEQSTEKIVKSISHGILHSRTDSLKLRSSVSIMRMLNKQNLDRYSIFSTKKKKKKTDELLNSSYTFRSGSRSISSSVSSVSFQEADAAPTVEQLPKFILKSQNSMTRFNLSDVEKPSPLDELQAKAQKLKQFSLQNAIEEGVSPRTGHQAKPLDVRELTKQKEKISNDAYRDLHLLAESQSSNFVKTGSLNVLKSSASVATEAVGANSKDTAGSRATESSSMTSSSPPSSRDYHSLLSSMKHSGRASIFESDIQLKRDSLYNPYAQESKMRPSLSISPLKSRGSRNLDPIPETTLEDIRSQQRATVIQKRESVMHRQESIAILKSHRMNRLVSFNIPPKGYASQSSLDSEDKWAKKDVDVLTRLLSHCYPHRTYHGVINDITTVLKTWEDYFIEELELDDLDVDQCPYWANDNGELESTEEESESKTPTVCVDQQVF
eukprot:GHVR01013468.1.p1 GENE.GHVR01013468.1~~GHVR01013468.1.p1  ORF type:complete len:567 (+),score=69.30 GHVR01013468.1:970-2670(+)